MLRPLVRSHAFTRRVTSSARQVGLDRAAPVRVVGLFGADSRQPARSAVRSSTWIRRVTRAAAHPALRDAGVLVRPHPSRTAEWEAIDTSRAECGRLGRQPDRRRARGPTTSTRIVSQRGGRRPQHQRVHRSGHRRPSGAHDHRAGVRGEPDTAPCTSTTCSMRAADCSTWRDGFDEHLSQLEAALGTPPASAKPFVRDFVRPLGLEQAATPVFVEAVESMQRHSRRSRRTRRVGAGLALAASAHRAAQRSTSVRTLDAVPSRARVAPSDIRSAAAEGDTPRDEPCRQRRQRQRRLHERERAFDNQRAQAACRRRGTLCSGEARSAHATRIRDANTVVRKVCVVVGSRANYSSIKSAMRAVAAHPDLTLQLVVGASALLDRFGSVVDLIEADGFTADAQGHDDRRGRDAGAPWPSPPASACSSCRPSSSMLKPDVVDQRRRSLRDDGDGGRRGLHEHPASRTRWAARSAAPSTRASATR